MYLKNQKECSESHLKSKSVSLKESFLGACTNFVYRIGGLGGINRVPHFLKKKQENQDHCLLGESFSDQSTVKQNFLNLIWFTYREKIKITQKLNSDVGWGCLPRVGQMVLAEALLKHYQNNGEKLDRKLYKKIILPFIDEDQNDKYSLSMILKYGRWKFSLTPGDWFNIGQISQVLKTIQDEQPMQGSKKLKIAFFNQSIMFLDQIYERAGMGTCQCLVNSLICEQCHGEFMNTVYKEKDDNYRSLSDFQIIQDEQEEKEEVKQEIQSKKQIYEPYHEENNDENIEYQHKFVHDVVVIVSVRISEKSVDALHFKAILSLLDHSTSLGIIGGVPAKALYFVGHSNGQLIYLDPHYVQQHIDRKNYQSNLKTFFCSSFRTINRQAVDPSMAFCFYLRTLEQLQSLTQKVKEVNSFLSSNNKTTFISFMECNEFDANIWKQNEGVFPENSHQSNSQEFNSYEFRDLTDSY